jgi:Zn-dependent M28 family amino/carboxypeptidase
MSHRLTAACAAVLAFAAALPATAQDFSAKRLSDHVRVLASDAFEGRAPATEGERKTIEYLITTYRKLGLEPGGAGGSWVQPVELLRFTPDLTGAAASYTVGGRTTPLTIGQDLTARARRPSGRVAEANAGLVFVGYGISAPERGWDDLAGLDLAGKVVLYLSGEPDDAATRGGPDAGPFEGSTLTLYGRNDHKLADFAKRGAVGVILLGKDAPTSAAWRNATGQLTRQTFSIAPKAGEPDLAFSGTLNAESGAALMAAGGLDLLAQRLAAAKAGFKGAALAGVTMSLNVAAKVDTIHSYNVLARIRGKTRPDETLLFTAHWDHLGKVATPDEKGDVIFNGAWDNASGTAAILEEARAFARGPRPDRSIVFINFTAEEQGLLGSRYYAAHPVWPLETTVAAFDIDMTPITGRTRDIEVIGFGKSDLEDDLAVAARKQGRVIVPDTHPTEGYYYRSDHFPFAEKGVPALMTWGGTDLRVGGKAVGAKEVDRLMETYYHKRNDEWRADLPFDAAVENLKLYYDVAHGLAFGRRWAQWKPTAEFKPLRDQSAAQRK